MIKAVVKSNGSEPIECVFDWRDAIIDAAIMASISGLTSWIASDAEIVAVKTAALAFFSFLALKRGLTTVQKAATK